ncbi:MAG: arginine deiminase-related protein [Acidobacteriota bacterium]|nr:arginine deiminase-related protein [Acidobacteriota bacterium]
MRSDSSIARSSFPGIRSNKPAFLMCPPTKYEVSYVINPWMEGNLGRSSQSRAMVQWNELYGALSGLASVHLVEPAAGSPDMVFTANAGLACNGTVVPSKFHHPERQGEEQHFRRWFTDSQLRVVDLPRGTSFEGEGDALFSTDGATLWVGYGARTQQASHAALASLWNVCVESLHLVDPRFYHLDTCFAPLEDGSLLYYPPAFDAASLERIHAYYKPSSRIVVNESDALSFACNAINVGKAVVLNHISMELQHALRARGFEVIQLALDEFLKAGGAAKCLVMKLPPAQTLNTPAY